MPGFHLAQLNIARMKFAIDDPRMADFVARLEDVNALADAVPGFVWRLQTDAGDRLDHLRRHGPGAYAFTFKRSFLPDRPRLDGPDA